MLTQEASYICYGAVPLRRCSNITLVDWLSSNMFCSGFPRKSTFAKALLEVGSVGYFVYALCGEERLEFPISTVNYCVLSIRIATLLQHQPDLDKRTPP